MYRIWLTVFGAGYLPLAPGTWGSAFVAVVYLVTALLSRSGQTTAAVMLLLTLHGSMVTIVFGPRLIKQLGPDPSLIVSDEQAGQALTYLWLWPLAAWTVRQIVLVTLAGFVLFRFFDILKPPPVRQLEKIPGAWGVLLDDLMAGLYALLILQLLFHLKILDFFAN